MAENSLLIPITTVIQNTYLRLIGGLDQAIAILGLWVVTEFFIFRISIVAARMQRGELWGGTVILHLI